MNQFLRIDKSIWGLTGTISTISSSPSRITFLLKKRGWYFSSAVITDQSLQYSSKSSYFINQSNSYSITLQTTIANATNLFTPRMWPFVVIKLLVTLSIKSNVLIEQNNRFKIDHVDVSISHVAMSLLIHWQIEEVISVLALLVDDTDKYLPGKTRSQDASNKYPLGMFRTINVVRLSSPRFTFSMSIRLSSRSLFFFGKNSDERGDNLRAW